MVMIRTGPGFYDPSGKCGGDVFHRDKSGLHIASYARTLSKQSTPAQKKQRSWYAGVKLEEHAGDESGPDTPDPDNPGTYMLYQMNELKFTRVRSILEPTRIDVPTIYDPSSPEYIAFMASYSQWSKLDGMTINRVMAYFFKTYYRNMYTWGQIEREAFADAVTETEAWLARSIAFDEFVWGNWEIWGYSGLFLAVVIAIYFSKQTVYHSFARGQSGVILDGTLMWAQLEQRASKAMYDFRIQADFPYPPISMSYAPQREGGWTYRLNWNNLLDSVFWSAGTWKTYNWQYLEIEGRCEGFPIGDNCIRCELEEQARDYYAVPIGYYNPDQSFAWTAEIYP